MFAANYQYLSYKYGLIEADWFTPLDHLVGKVKKKMVLLHPQPVLSCGILKELCGIRDNTSSCDIVNNNNIVALINNICINSNKLLNFINKLLNFISDNNILYDHQYGFRKGRSTQQAIITLVDKITKSQDIGDIVITLLIDLKKAFDTIDHRILLRKLYSYGLRGSMLKWMESYLKVLESYFSIFFNGKFYSLCQNSSI